MSHYAPHLPHEVHARRKKSEQEDRARRLRFLETLTKLEEAGQWHLLKIETVAELRELQELATGSVRVLLDKKLGDLDALANQLRDRLAGQPKEERR